MINLIITVVCIALFALAAGYTAGLVDDIYGSNKQKAEANSSKVQMEKILNSLDKQSY